MKSFKFVVSLGLLLALLPLSFYQLEWQASRPPLSLAQSVGESTAVAMPPAQSTAETVVWRARLVDVIPNVVLGGGAILRVHVQNRSGELIEVQQINTILRNTTGTKPEYGPFAAEFAPIPAGRWLVSVPALGVSLAVQTDDRSLFVVEFAEIPVAQATAEARMSATPTPLGGTPWGGQQTGQVEGPSMAGALLRVKIVGRPGILVDLATLTGFAGQGITGSKAENPSDEVEFAGLAPGQYIITPHGLNYQMMVTLEFNTTTFVEFRPVQPSPTPTATTTPTPRPPTPTPRPTNTPTPTPTPPIRWLVSVAQRDTIERATPNLVIEVERLPNEAITILGGDPPQEIVCIASVPNGNERYRCEVTTLLPGRYTLSWAKEGLSIPLQLESKQRVVVIFRQALAPLEATTWRAHLSQNTNIPIPTGLSESIVGIHFADRVGQVISLVNSHRQRRLCETDQFGWCQFTGLEAGVYLIEPANISTRYALYLDGHGQAQVDFEEQLLLAETEQTATTPITGRGARPKPSPTATNTPTPTPAPPTATPKPTFSATPPPPTATPTPSPTPTLTSTPTIGWFGSVAESYQNPGQTIVVRAPLGDHPVILQSGPWQTEGRTGSKPEYGQGAVEFAGLSPGTYTIILAGLAEQTITLPSDHFILLQFAFGLVPSPAPTPTPQPGQWAAAILNNSSGSEPGGGAWSILTVEVRGVDNLPIQVSTDGFETGCISGSKPELGSGVCQIGGLWPATYRVQPAGLPVSIEVSLDGRGAAWIAFWQQ